MPALSLKEKFREKARNSRALRYLFNHSLQISALGYLAANVILTAKQGIHVDLDTLAGLGFLGADLAILKGKNPTWFKVAGVCVMAASFTLAASPYGKPGFIPQVISMIPSFVSGAMMLREGKKDAPAKDADKPRNALTRSWNFFVNRYPTMTAGLMNLPGKPLLLASALMRGDFGLAATALGWTVGNIGLAASDKMLQEDIMRPKDPQPAPGLS